MALTYLCRSDSTNAETTALTRPQTCNYRRCNGEDKEYDEGRRGEGPNEEGDGQKGRVTLLDDEAHDSSEEISKTIMYLRGWMYESNRQGGGMYHTWCTHETMCRRGGMCQ